MKTERVGIIGLDKVSASIGLAIRAADMGLEILGADRDKDKLVKAKDIRAIDKGSGNPLDVAKVADILILSVPMGELDETLQIIGPDVQEHTLIVDLSTLKGPGLALAHEHLSQGHFIGASPVLAASSLSDGRRGIGAATADLFANSVFCITPSGTTDPDAVNTTVNLGRILGSTPFFLDPYEYDSLMQGVETAPALVAAAIFRSVTQATGWRDMLRFAGSTFALSTAGLENESLTEQIYRDKAATMRWLDAILTELQEFRRWLLEEDKERVSLILEEMGLERERWLHERRQNNWIEVEPATEIGSISIASQLFGFGSRKKGKKK